ncbi:MAG: hypothetical protein A2070_04960 [Bdellovibrionales bacterium GWC1_52_8]|nr:MAG: hypothetical protein A2Z97_03505 [Bdellovibrionales bacterium GWB1_52_6]OFZ04038.1 MAG: hypothetical protein A2X97_14640 [Bdellovibrionales bacterium GWA1_52_35]OFZ35242.1 MAG: hypothetical protein A2070_04960 [Bdellovibrionales bacterium GWC1_52_8]
MLACRQRSLLSPQRFNLIFNKLQPGTVRHLAQHSKHALHILVNYRQTRLNTFLFLTDIGKLNIYIFRDSVTDRLKSFGIQRNVRKVLFNFLFDRFHGKSPYRTFKWNPLVLLMPVVTVGRNPSMPSFPDEGRSAFTALEETG